MIGCQFCKNFEPAEQPNYYVMPPDYRVYATDVGHQPEPHKPSVLYEDGIAVITYKGDSFLLSWPLNKESYLERLLEWITQI